jgi:hypothetical protein
MDRDVYGQLRSLQSVVGAQCACVRGDGLPPGHLCVPLTTLSSSEGGKCAASQLKKVVKGGDGMSKCVRCRSLVPRGESLCGLCKLHVARQQAQARRWAKAAAKAG